jgi:murein DD-endopeptidase MepM/ murein hydrolase activator NlpD
MSVETPPSGESSSSRIKVPAPAASSGGISSSSSGITPLPPPPSPSAIAASALAPRAPTIPPAARAVTIQSIAPPTARPPTVPALPPPPPAPAPLEMRAALSTPPLATRTIACPRCKGPVDVKSPHVAVTGGAVRIYCSATCLESRDLPLEAETVAITPPPKRRRVWLAAAAVLLVVTGTSAFLMRDELAALRDAPTPPSPAIAVVHEAANPQPSAANDPQREADAALTTELMQAAWIHPLAGPTRRMPRAHTGAFGAERGGERPPECVSGHCGVDVGNEWGERVYAVHDGVIDFVNRGPNEERGGVFVRIAHREGTLFSWYFHLAAVPRSIRPGVKVSAGTLIGLLGDTGVKHSAPHLHFALSVKTSKHVNERYLDPEPLIAIWPLWLPNENGRGGALATSEPGLPMRGDTGPKRKKSRKSKAAKKQAVDAPVEAAPAAEPSPSTDTAGGTPD